MQIIPTWLRRRSSGAQSSATVLLAWELGSGMGHVSRLARVAEVLAREQPGAPAPVFCVRHTDERAIRGRLPNVRIVQAPIGDRVTADGAASDYAQMLYRCGYHSAEALREVVQGWRGVLDEVRPAVVICDHSPTVVLACAGRVPVIHIGSGFATPPAGKPFLTLTRNRNPGDAAREAQVLESIRSVQQHLGQAPIAAVSDLLGLARNVTCCLPELDPYRSTRDTPALGPVGQLPEPRPLPAEPFLFGYLTGFEVGVPDLLRQLVAAKVPAGFFIREMDPVCDDLVQGSSVELYYSPQKLDDAVGRATAVLHHGGLSTTEVALAIGRPQFLWPRHVEQSLTASAVERLGCGISIKRNLAGAADLIAKALRKRTYERETAAVAARLATRPQVDVAADIARAAVECLERGRATT